MAQPSEVTYYTLTLSGHWHSFEQGKYHDVSGCLNLPYLLCRRATRQHLPCQTPFTWLLLQAAELVSKLMTELAGRSSDAVQSGETSLVRCLPNVSYMIGTGTLIIVLLALLSMEVVEVAAFACTTHVVSPYKSECYILITNLSY